MSSASIRATNGAHNALMDLEEMDEAALEEFRGRFSVLARAAREARLNGGSDTDTPDC